jgi:hypothetical protein
MNGVENLNSTGIIKFIIIKRWRHPQTQNLTEAAAFAVMAAETLVEAA